MFGCFRHEREVGGGGPQTVEFEKVSVAHGVWLITPASRSSTDRLVDTLRFHHTFSGLRDVLHDEDMTRIVMCTLCWASRSD
jgi:hypothetical protein